MCNTIRYFIILIFPLLSTYITAISYFGSLGVKRVLCSIILAVTAIFSAAAVERIPWKAGIMLGYPTAITAGYRFNSSMEANGLVGVSYIAGSFAPVGGIFGANMLFNIMDFDISNESFQLSAGPQINALLGSGYIGLEFLADLRLEYTFWDYPINIFTEIGIGARYISTGSKISVTGMGNIGARYVF